MELLAYGRLRYPMSARENECRRFTSTHPLKHYSDEVRKIITSNINFERFLLTYKPAVGYSPTMSLQRRLSMLYPWKVEYVDHLTRLHPSFAGF